MAEVSIIVPIYNAEKTLPRCIESVINQEFTDFELILCNDGSSDNSGLICDEYQEKDSRIKVIHKENTGVSDTRNKALQIATGQYIQFLDADDWITVDATKLMVRRMKETDADLVISDFYRVVGKRTSHKGDIDIEDVMNQETFAQHMMENPADFYYGVLWNKLFKREIIEKYQIKMDENVSWCEDFLFNLEYILHANRIATLLAPIYYYVKTEGSLASQGMNITKTVKMKISVFEYYNEFYKHVYEEKDYSKRRLGVYKFLIDAATDGFAFLGKKLGEERVTAYVYDNIPDNMFTEHYLQRKLIEQYLEVIALRNGLELQDMVLLANLPSVSIPITIEELSDYTGYDEKVVSQILQKLVKKKVLYVVKIKRTLQISFTDEYQFLVNEMENVKRDYDKIRFQDLSSENADIYEKLNCDIMKNIKRLLVKSNS